MPAIVPDPIDTAEWAPGVDAFGHEHPRLVRISWTVLAPQPGAIQIHINGELRDVVYGVHTTRGIRRGSQCYPIRSIRSRRFKYIMNLNAESEAFSNLLAWDDHTSPVLASWKALGGRAAERARFYRHRPAEELYDLASDPYELTNLAGRPELSGQREELRGRLKAWMRQQGDEGMPTEMRAQERQGRRRR